MDTPVTVCSIVLAYVVEALENIGRPVADALVAVGTVAIDDCCAGTLYVAPERTYRTTDPFPLEAGLTLLRPASICEEAPIGIEVVVGLFRCAATADDNGNPPSVDAQNLSATELLNDAATIWNAVTSRALLGDNPYDPGEPLWRRARESQTYVSADGGCVGVETRMTLGVGQSGWCGEGVG